VPADKVWRQLKPEDVQVARCTGERLMKRLGLEGARRGKVVRTTVPGKSLSCPLDRVNRQFKADRPNQLWVSDFTYVSTWQGWLYVAFVIDVFGRRIVGWRVSSSMHTDFVLDALEQALYARQPGRMDALVHHSDSNSQYVSIRYTERLASRNRTLGRQQGRQLRQRAGRDHQWAVQNRIDSQARPLENQGGRGAGNAEMGGLVQQPAAAGTNRLHPSRRS